MPIEYCRNCGSTSFRADRALAGKVICARCGLPIDKTNKFTNYKTVNNLLRKKTRRNIFIFIGFIVFIIIIFYNS